MWLWRKVIQNKCSTQVCIGTRVSTLKTCAPEASVHVCKLIYICRLRVRRFQLMMSLLPTLRKAPSVTSMRKYWIQCSCWTDTSSRPTFILLIRAPFHGDLTLASWKVCSYVSECSLLNIWVIVFFLDFCPLRTYYIRMRTCLLCSSVMF